MIPVKVLVVLSDWRVRCLQQIAELPVSKTLVPDEALGCRLEAGATV